MNTVKIQVKMVSKNGSNVWCVFADGKEYFSYGVKSVAVDVANRLRYDIGRHGVSILHKD